MWKDAFGQKSSVVIPYENTIFGAARALFPGNQALVTALQRAQATVSNCFARGLACKISNASVIKPTYYGLNPGAAGAADAGLAEAQRGLYLHLDPAATAAQP